MNFTYERCQFFYPLPTLRLYFVGLFGCIISIISIAENSLLLFTLLKTKHYRSSHELYLIFLSFFDVLLSLLYIWINSLILFIRHWDFFVFHKFWYVSFWYQQEVERNTDRVDHISQEVNQCWDFGKKI